MKFTLRHLISLFILAASMSSSVADPATNDPFAPDAFTKSEPEKIEAQIAIISSVSSIQANTPFEIAIEVKHPKDYHSYYKVDAYNLPLEFNLQLPAGFTHKAIQWPVPKVKYKYNALTLYYEKTQYFLTTVHPPKNLTATSVDLKATVRVQLCTEDSCLAPVSHDTSLNLSVAESSSLNAAGASTIQNAKALLPLESSEWATATSVENNQLLLDLQSPLDLTQVEGLVFAPEEKFIDFGAKHLVTKTDGGYQISIPLKLEEGQSLPDPLTGILTSTSGQLTDGLTGVYISSGLKVDAAQITAVKAEKPTASSEHNVRLDTPAEIIAMAELYDPSQKVKYITLDQIPDDLSDLSSLTASTEASANAKANTSLLSTFGLIFIGGMILNLMPCVFPVLGVKVLGFAQLSGNDPKKIKKHGFIFTVGVVVSMWILAGAILAIQAQTQTEATWGEQMGNPVFVAVICTLLFLFGLNLFGVFEIGTSLTGAGGNLQSKKGYSGSFFSGALTTLIATPCSGPFLGTAIAIALAKPPFIAMLIFTVFALGIAFPYALLAFFPDLINKLPRPGGWMVTFKKIMAFPMFLTAILLMRTFGHQTGMDGLWWFSLALVVFGFAAFCYGHWGSPFTKKKPRFILGYGFSLILIAGASALTYKAINQEPPTADTLTTGPGGLKWKPWKPGKVEHAKERNKPLWIDYTATWCFTCQTNKATIFANDEVKKLVLKHDLELIKVDITSPDPVKTADLARTGRSTIPVNLVYPIDSTRPPVLLEGLITPGNALKALRYALAE